MEVKITGRHMDVSDDLKKIATRKVTKLRKFFPRVQMIEVLLTQQKYRYQVEILVTADHFSFEARDESDDLQTSMDETISKLETQLRRNREKILDRKHVKRTME